MKTTTKNDISIVNSNIDPRDGAASPRPMWNVANHMVRGKPPLHRFGEERGLKVWRRFCKQPASRGLFGIRGCFGLVTGRKRQGTGALRDASRLLLARLSVGGGRSFRLPAGILAVVIGLVCAGCKGTLGTDSVNISGSVMSHGTLVGGSFTVASNTVSIGGSFAQGNTTNSGAISVAR